MAGLFTACSKKDAEVEAAGDAPAIPTESNPQIAKDLEKLDQDLQSKNYQEVIGSLGVLRAIPKSREDQYQYELKSRQVEADLAQRAQTDPAARQAHQLLGRMQMGR